MGSQLGTTGSFVERLLREDGWREPFNGPVIGDDIWGSNWEKVVGGSIRRVRIRYCEPICGGRRVHSIEEEGTQFDDLGWRFDFETGQGVFSFEGL